MDDRERYNPEPSAGLTAEQVAGRMRDGLCNGEDRTKTKSFGAILRDNLCTLFNLMNFVLAAVVICVGSYKNALFICIILCNILIGTVQEIRAKLTVGKLSLISAPRVRIIRDGKAGEYAVSQMVLDDIVELGPGNQVCADSIVALGTCEVDESLLTGESDAVLKAAGDRLYSGSFIVSGTCRARVDAVGEENYAAKIAADARQIKKTKSEILSAFNRIIRTISIVIVPLGILLFCKDYLLLHSPLQEATVSTVAALIGMIPEGLILLTSVVMAVGVIRLSRHRTLVQDIYCIESLARVDVLCLDKTGTITEGRMDVREIVQVEKEADVPAALAALAAVLTDENPTFCAIRSYIAAEDMQAPGWQAAVVEPFSPVRKWSGATFQGEGTFVLGAAEFVFRNAADRSWQAKTQEYAAQGYRVLALAHSAGAIEEKRLPADIRPVAYLLLRDVIRAEAPETLAFFRRQGVDIKIISGDDPRTVASVAKEAGLENTEHYLDASTVSDGELFHRAGEYTVFGRVTPAQKRVIVQGLKDAGHTVAMTGDGVNDVLALKDADCSIAVAAGSDAARSVAKLVLLDSNFSAMYNVVMEGRRAINNIERSSSLFLVKTIFSFLLSILFVFIPMSYPFQPIQLSLISSLAVGVPSFFLALQPNRDRIRGNFLFNILKRAVPGALTVVLNICIIVLVSWLAGFTEEQSSTLAMLLTGITAICVLARVCMPFNFYRGALLAIVMVGFLAAVLIMGDFFMIAPFTTGMWICLAVQGILIVPVMWLLFRQMNKIERFIEKRVLTKLKKTEQGEMH